MNTDRKWWLAAAWIFSTQLVFGATPPAGTLTDTSGPLIYTAGPFNIANPTPVPEVDVGPHCNNPTLPCDDFALTVQLPVGYMAAHPNAAVQVSMNWTDAGSGSQ